MSIYKKFSEINYNLPSPNKIEEAPLNTANLNMDPTKENYSHSQKIIYNKFNHSNDIVGNFEWHEQMPYEQYLLNIDGDINKPIFESYSDKLALDFGCGPGRMVKRMNKLFARTDGADISKKLLIDAQAKNPKSFFYETSGSNLGATPDNYYDFIYCTISMQHISSYTIRKEILEEMNKKLKSGGKITLQLAFTEDKAHFNKKTNNSKYFEDKYNLGKTNGLQDVAIIENDLVNIENDFNSIFKNTKIWLYRVNDKYSDLNGCYHGPYWATHWIFIHSEKV